ncbi:LysR family transcriptional regulator [soil metagenome]
MLDFNQMKDYDLNLLKALNSLIETESVTRMGEHLGITQPAASRVMTRLRKAFGDPLLVRTSKGYVLTPRAIALKLTTCDALAKANQVFFAADFDPLTSSRRFRVASTDYGSVVVLDGVLRSLALQGKKLGIHILPWKEQTLNDLESGELDLALYADDPVPGDFHTRDLFRETYGVLLSKSHPLVRKTHVSTPLRASELTDFPQLVATYPSGRKTEVDDVLAQLGHKSSAVQMAVPYFLAAPWLLKDTNYIMLCPRRAAVALAEHPDMVWRSLASKACDFTYRMLWHERANRDAGLTWLRELVLKTQRKPV